MGGEEPEYKAKISEKAELARSQWAFWVNF